MDRRTALTHLWGKGQRLAVAPSAPPINSGLAPYTGPWAFQQAAHLLRRGMFGPTYPQLKRAVTEGLDATLDRLFENRPMPEPPLNYDYPDDSDVPIGETWINGVNPSPANGLFNVSNYRRRSLKAWAMEQIWREGVSIREKLTLFWHNHIPIAAILDPKFAFRYFNLLRKHAVGNFRELIKEVTIDPAMLRYLDGKYNRASAPNENYARELLELFTIGKKAQEVPGDYGNYNEQDIWEIARALTGWRNYGYNYHPDYTNGEFGSEFFPGHHDTGAKQLSHHFNNAVINNQGDQEYAHVIDIIFEQAEVARFICRRLYMWFVYYEIDEEAETKVIEPMAQILRDNDYEIAPALRALLSSQHFFDTRFYGTMIKNPADFMFSALKTLRVGYSGQLDKKYDSCLAIFKLLQRMQMEFFDLPEVAGWLAYYREPLYYRHWVSATTLPFRSDAMYELANDGIRPDQGNGTPMRADVLKLISTFDNPENPDSVVREFTKMLLPKPLTTEQYATLKDILLSGLPDFEWAEEYGAYADDPDGSGMAGSIEARLRSLVGAILSMPEFQLT